MRKIILKTTIAVVAMAGLAACTDSDIISTAETMSVEEAMQPSDVEIVLGATAQNMTSRASIESDGVEHPFFRTNKNDTLGVFALATGIIENNAKYYGDVTIKWAGDWVEEKNKEGKVIGKKHVFNDAYSVYLNNVRAGVTYVSNSFGATLGSRIAWMDTKNGKVYYPLGSMHKYSFYAYNPRVDSINYSADRIVAVMRNLKGCEDVIWGACEPAMTDPVWNLAYSADYFRQKVTMDRYDETKSETTFNFQHKMMRLTFEILPGAEDESLPPMERNYDEAYKTTVHSISIINAPDEVQLVVADKTLGAENMQGALTYSSARNKKYYLKERRKNIKGETVLDSLLAPVSPRAKDPLYVEGNRDETNVPDTIKIGEGIILPALNDVDRMNNPYKMQLLLEYPKGTYQVKTFTLNAPYGKFEPGMSYNLKLKIYSPKDISISATASQWQLLNDSQYNSYVDPLKEQTEKRIEEEKKKKEEEEKKKSLL
ncbi:MAG: fimbrillin family protein [Prevotella sp.]|nr:fimbrillin family protein [Candidatus Prevotella equi]